MASTPAIMKGVIHGKTIELDREPGLTDGQTVVVTVQPVPMQCEPLAPGE
jgi:hypothetical protein